MPNKRHICKEGRAGNKKNNAAACLCFLNYLAFLRPAADRAVSILPWVVSRGRSYGFLWAGSIIQKHVRKDNPISAYSPVRPTELVPQISEPNYQEKQIIEKCKAEGRAVFTQKTAVRRKMGKSCIGSLDR
jgi:hypothetical protein